MDGIFKRLKYYGIGFSIGLVFVIFFFQNRGCSWLPDNRVKNSILDRVLVVPDSELALMGKYGITKKELSLVLNDGEVLFKESKKEGNPKVYVIEKETLNSKKQKFYFILAKESFIAELHFSHSPKDNSTQGEGEMIYFPDDKNLVFPDSSSNVNCQQDFLKMVDSRDILKSMKRYGKIDFSKSYLSITPKPEHFLTFKDKENRTISCKAIWYKNKINITNFIIPYNNPCN